MLAMDAASGDEEGEGFRIPAPTNETGLSLRLVLELRPTQLAVGFQQVREKEAHVKKKQKVRTCDVVSRMNGESTYV